MQQEKRNQRDPSKNNEATRSRGEVIDARCMVVYILYLLHVADLTPVNRMALFSGVRVYTLQYTLRASTVFVGDTAQGRAVAPTPVR